MSKINFAELSLLLIASLYTDFKVHKMKNYILLSFAVIGLATNFTTGGFGALASSFIGIITPIFLLFILYILKMLGAGDIKLFACIGAIMGYTFVLPVLVYAFLAGGVLALIIMLCRGNLRLRFFYLYTYLKFCFLTQDIKPYAQKLKSEDGSSFCFSIAIAIGCIIQVVSIYKL